MGWDAVLQSGNVPENGDASTADDVYEGGWICFNNDKFKIIVVSILNALKMICNGFSQNR